MAETAGRLEPHGAADPAQPGGAQMALEPAAVAARHVDEELMEIATAKAEAALNAVPRALPGEDRDYLTAKAERWQKWAATALKQMERN